jgi:deazaflavin-dependent oxidoreductase (nitroreductase family)
MPLTGEYEPSPWDMIAEQVHQYESSGGTEGTLLEGQPCVILTTRGRHTGKLRKTPLMRVEHEGGYAMVASMGGAPKHPVWYFNLLAHPDEVTVQDGPDVFDLHAREVEGDEKAAWWARAVEVWPAYDDYQANTDRVIPVVVLEPRP